MQFFRSLAIASLGLAGCGTETRVSDIEGAVLQLTAPLRTGATYAAGAEVSAQIDYDKQDEECLKLDELATAVLYSVNMKQISRGGDVDGACKLPLYTLPAGELGNLGLHRKTFALFDSEGSVKEAEILGLGDQRWISAGELTAGSEASVQFRPATDVLANVTVRFESGSSEVFSVSAGEVTVADGVLRFNVPAGATGSGTLKVTASVTPKVSDCSDFERCSVTPANVEVSTEATIR